MSRIWFLVALAIGFVGGMGASIPLQSRVVVQDKNATPANSAMEHSSKSKHSGHSQHSAHNHDKLYDVPAGPAAPTLNFDIAKDTAGGWNLHIKASNFRFSPETVNGENVPGEGHAHVYIDGKKVARVYGAWFHLASVPTRPYKLQVSLNANDHSTLAVGGTPLTLTKTIK